MKSTFRRLQCGILAVAWLLAGCNSDVFIDRFLSEEPMGHRTKRFFQWSGKMGERF